MNSPSNIDDNDPDASSEAALRARISELEARISEKDLEVDALREVGQAIGSMLDIDEMLKMIADIVIKVTGTDLCLIYLLDSSKRVLILRGGSGVDAGVIGRVRLKVGEGITGWVAREKTHVALSSEPWRDKRFKPVPNLGEDKFQSMLSVPLRGRENLVGVINVRTNPPHDYTSVQISLLDSIARQVGGAVENYMQYRRMEQRASQLSTLSEISKTITSDLYLEEILQLDRGHDRRVSQLQDLLDHAPRRRQERARNQSHSKQEPRVHKETQRKTHRERGGTRGDGEAADHGARRPQDPRLPVRRRRQAGGAVFADRAAALRQK